MASKTLLPMFCKHVLEHLYTRHVVVPTIFSIVVDIGEIICFGIGMDIGEIICFGIGMDIVDVYTPTTHESIKIDFALKNDPYKNNKLKSMQCCTMLLVHRYTKLNKIWPITLKHLDVVQIKGVGTI